MKILYLMTEPFGVGGVQSDLLTLSEDLTRMGHEVHVATTEGVLLDELKSKGARHVDIDFQYRGLAGLWGAALALRKTVRERGIELIAPQSVRSTIVAYFAMRILPFGFRSPATGRALPIVTTIHNIHNPRHFSYVGHILQRCSDYVIFESRYERERLLASGLDPHKSCVIHSGIDTDRFVAQAPDAQLLAQHGIDPKRHVVFGIVARLSEEKGHTILVDAFGLLYRQHPQTRLLVVGDGPLLDSVKAKVAQSGLDEAIIFTGLQRNVPAFLAMMQVFVLASTRESFPLAAREAMAAGKPVIAPRIGGCPEVVEHQTTGLLFPSRDVGALAAAMTALLDAEVRERFSLSARERVERLFSRRSWVRGDEQIYAQMLAEGSVKLGVMPG